MKLEPSEIIIAIDAPESPRLVERIKQISFEYDYANIRILPMPKRLEWNFQLANIVWHCYQEAKYDRILSFDVDSILTRNVLLGLNDIGKNEVAVVSFTKRLRIKNLSDLIRHFFYRLRVHSTDYVFSGIYWVYRPYFFDTIDLDKYKSLKNGVDTFLTNQILRQGQYTIITRKEIGVKCMTLQNEDYPWRQFQLGIWMGANDDRWAGNIEERKKIRARTKVIRRHPIKTARNIASKILHFRLWDLDRHLVLYVYLKAFLYQHPYLLKGYKWAKTNPDHEVVKLARGMDQYEWGYLGGKFISAIEGIELKGTGA